jgi:hypothetical protein
MLFKIFYPKKLTFSTQNTPKLCKKSSIKLVCNKKSIFSPKIAEISDHNIEPSSQGVGKHENN